MPPALGSLNDSQPKPLSTLSERRGRGDETLYETPEIRDYGTLAELTAATLQFGPEDGASKLDTANHHSFPVS